MTNQLKWTTTSAAGNTSGIKCLVYGDSGVGKTRLCATAPRPLILSAEPGLLSVREYDIPVIDIDNPEDLENAFRFVTQDVDYMANIDTICLDSISQIAEHILIEAKKMVKDPRQAYGEMAERVFATVKDFCAIKGKNVVFIAKEKYFVDENNGVGMFMPSFPGKQLGSGIVYEFDEVFAMRVGVDPEGQSYRYLQTDKDFKYKAKDRSGALSPSEFPDLTALFTKILGEK